MLWVCASEARKSSAWAMSTALCGPGETTVEKPTAFLRAQSRIDAVNAPDCDTSASGPGDASGPATLALSPMRGRCTPRLLGPMRRRPWRRAMSCRLAAPSASYPCPSTSAAPQRMRPATSSAAGTSCSGRAMMARSARAWARSARVPLVWMSRKFSTPSNACARRALNTAAACGVGAASSPGRPANTTTDFGANKGVR